MICNNSIFIRFLKRQNARILRPTLVLISSALLAASCGPRDRPSAPTILTPLTQAEHVTLQAKLLTGQAVLPSERFRPTAPRTPIDETPAPSAQQAECNEFRAKLPRNVTQGFVAVPEDWSNPQGTKIRVFYYARLIKGEQGQVVDPTVHFNGGPSLDSHVSYEILEGENGSQSLSMIYLDQRGTGCSDPYPKNPISAATASRLAHYGSRAIVRDAEAIREKLLGPHTQWRAFGQSYGGHIAHRYVTIAPQSLSAVFIHGHAVVSDPVAKIAERLRSQLEISHEYFARYPGDRERLAAIRQAIATDHCFEDGLNRVCGPSIMDATAVLLSMQSQWKALHSWLKKLKPRAALDEAVLTEFVRTLVFGVFASGENGFAASVLTHLDIVPGYTDTSVCEAATLRLTRDFDPDPPALWPINECRLLGELRYPGEALIASSAAGDPIPLSDLASQLSRFPELRFYLYSGLQDSMIPSTIFAEETRILGRRINYRRFDQSGHEGFYTEPQVWEDLNSR